MWVGFNVCASLCGYVHVCVIVRVIKYLCMHICGGGRIGSSVFSLLFSPSARNSAMKTNINLTYK